MTEIFRSASSPEFPLNKERPNGFKALVLDVDGTILNGRSGLPSQRVIDTVREAREKLHVGLATSRPIFEGLKPVFSALELEGPSIINAGASIIDAKTHETLWERNILRDDVEKVHFIAAEYGIDFLFTSKNGNFKFVDFPPTDETIQMWAHALDKDLADELIDQFSSIPTVAPVKVGSWVEGKMDIVISHASATKQHGILELSKILGISTHEIIGVGDGYNDFPLLMACGLKVAMGNAVPDLKAIADYVAPTVDEDGVADVIERFIL